MAWCDYCGATSCYNGVRTCADARAEAETKGANKPIREPDALSPSHYADFKPEPIDVIADWNLNFNRGNAVKYIVRAGKKDPAKTVEDLQKAIVYLQHEIKRCQNNG